jgi:hypothetical protein
MFASFFRKRRIRQYARALPDELTALYGQQEHYSKAQIDRALAHKGFRKEKPGYTSTSISDYCYAYAMYCSHDEFDRIHAEAGENCDYDAMRSDISEACFSSTDGFTFQEMESYASESSSSDSSDSGSWGDSGGDSGGSD